MSGPQLLPISSQPNSLSDAVSDIARHVSELLRRLRDLEEEEAELNERALQLVEQPPKTKGMPSTPSHPSSSTSDLRPSSRTMIGRGAPSTSSVDPSIYPPAGHGKHSSYLVENLETPVKAFLLMESFALAMSIKSRRKGRIFLAGDSTEFGER